MHATKQLKGSPYRDAVKHWHKTLPNDLYACDIDLALIGFSSLDEPVEMILDVKSPKNHDLSNTHKQLYDWFISNDIPVWLITLESYTKVYCEHCDNYEIVIAEDSEITVTEYISGGSRTMTRSEYIIWERQWRS